MDEPIGSGLWLLGDLVKVVLRSTLGLVGIFAAWFGCSGTIVFRDNLIWIAAGVAATIFGLSGPVSWLIRGIAGVKRAAADIARAARAEEAALLVARPHEDSAGDFVSAAGMRRYHLPDCELVAGKPVQRVSGANLLPCGMCNP
jgi:hypothetical protein